MNLDDQLMQRAKDRARHDGTTLTRVVEHALRAALDEPEAAPNRFVLNFPTVGGGAAIVDPADRGAVYDILDGRAPGYSV